jgi:hypothetical protein
MAMSLVPMDEPLQPWITPGDPEHIYFMAGGTEYIFDTDIDLVYVVVANNQAATIEFLNWLVVENVPEPPAFWLLLTALLLLGVSRWAQMNLRKLSRR